MNTKIMALLALSFALSGCGGFRQPKEFKNRKMKEDPPILNQAPSSPAPQAGLRFPQAVA